MQTRLMLNFYRLHKRLWVKPLAYCLLAIVAVSVAKGADFLDPLERLPEIDPDTVETLLSIISSTMMVMATFAVGSMVAAYASASDNATPRAFQLVLTDDLSQTALSSFVGAFIFSVVALVALKTGVYDNPGHFALLGLTIAVIGWVILTFVRWVDNIARLGRMSSTIDRAEEAARDCLADRRRQPHLGGRDASEAPKAAGTTVHAERIGYLQLVDVAQLQEAAEDAAVQVVVEALPGTFVSPDQPLMRLIGAKEHDDELRKRLTRAFVIGSDRTFEADPRFGLIVLSEIAQRALSTGVNDPGTAIMIIGRMVRLFAFWLSPEGEGDDADDDDDDDTEDEEVNDRVFVPALDLADMFDDAFTGISRDGAGNIEVGIRLQKAFASLAVLGDGTARTEAARHARLALARAEAAIDLEDDLDRLRKAAHVVLREVG
jgi:uncharacterized membrane protein